MDIWSQDLYTKAWNFAADAHLGQKVPGGDRPYITHISIVAMEVMAAIARSRSVDDPDLAVQCALLHDVIEDTETTYDQVLTEFGQKVADGVRALSKNPRLKLKSQKMADSLDRIKKQPKAVWMVKLADRITNLQPPPHYWSSEKIKHYRKEAIHIHETLGTANAVLSRRLLEKIENYKKFIEEKG